MNGLHILQLHSSPFQSLILLLKLERVFDCFMSFGSACHNLHARNDIVSKSLHVARACGSCRLSQRLNPYGLFFNKDLLHEARIELPFCFIDLRHQQLQISYVDWDRIVSN